MPDLGRTALDRVNQHFAAICPISLCSMRTVVSGGETTSISGMSL
jgi:hypothetical protein